MYMTFFARSPCAKTVSFIRNLVIFLPEPSESRKASASKACFPLSSILNLVLLGHGRGAAACMAFTPADLRLTAIEFPITTPFMAIFRQSELSSRGLLSHRLLSQQLRPLLCTRARQVVILSMTTAAWRESPPDGDRKSTRLNSSHLGI